MEQHKTSGFLEDFPAVSTAEWEKKIVEDLKGADYQKRLVWKTPEGVIAMPYYRVEHLASLAFIGTLPGEAPYVRGNKIKNNDWDILQEIDEEDIAAANAQALEMTGKGVEALSLNLQQVNDKENLARLLQGLDLSKTALHFTRTESFPGLFESLLSLAGDVSLKGAFVLDPLGHLFLFGGQLDGLDQELEQLSQMIHLRAGSHPNFRLVTISGQHYQNAGAGITQELAFILSQACEYLVRLREKGCNTDEVAKALCVRVAIGPSYFLEIAKIRALRILWSTMVAQFYPTKKESSQLVLHAESSLWNKSVYDPYVNLLRTTTEAMAAAIGGVDSLLLHPFDATFRKPGAFSLRLARNQQIILRHEAYFDKVVDPAAGSYYVENLTRMIASAAWNLFVETEQMGGFAAIASNGFLKTEIENSARKREQEIAHRRQVLVGTNQYPDAGERVLEKLQPTAKLTDLGVLRMQRGASAFEALRLEVESHEQKGLKTPSVFLLTYGNLSMRKARAGFCANFFGIAGYSVTEGAGHATASEAVADAMASKSDVVVLCSSDEEYAEAIPAVTTLKEQVALVVVAGNPTALAKELDKAGVDAYIHLRTNALETLQWFNEMLLGG